MTVIKERGIWASARGGVGLLLELLSGNSLIGGLHLVCKQFNVKILFVSVFLLGRSKSNVFKSPDLLVDQGGRPGD
jgi:hypothetical protein